MNNEKLEKANEIQGDILGLTGQLASVNEAKTIMVGYYYHIPIDNKVEIGTEPSELQLATLKFKQLVVDILKSQIAIKQEMLDNL